VKNINLLTNEQMKAAEKYGMDRGIPSIILMENAARCVTDEVLKQKPNYVTAVCGKGNNGGDGLAVARQLVTNGIKTNIVFVGDKEKATPDCKTNLDILQNFSNSTDLINIIYIDKNAEDIKNLIDDCDLIVDALTGTGLNRKLSDSYSELANIINNSKKYVVSVDCPTGINTDTGEDYGIAVNADKTVTFHYPKIGMMLYPAYSHIGELVIGNIGMPYFKTDSAFMLTDKSAFELLPKRSENSHKGTYGKVVAISGCDTMTGAAVFNAKSAYKTGCGLVQLCSTKHCVNVVQNSVPEAITTILPDTDGYISDFDESIAKGATAIAIGSGLGCTPNGVEVVKKVLALDLPTVVDADALNIVAKYNLQILLKNKIITPHIKEMSRLCGIPTNEIIQNIVSCAVDFAKKYSCIVVLKSAHSIIADNDGKVCVNITGSSSMSKGGSGDCLTGIISSLLAQGMSDFQASALGAYINGKAGEFSAKNHTQYSALASDLIDGIENVLMEFENVIN
jgi:NAD(P)H-hydrate epimerase